MTWSDVLEDIDTIPAFNTYFYKLINSYIESPVKCSHCRYTQQKQVGSSSPFKKKKIFLKFCWIREWWKKKKLIRGKIGILNGKLNKWWVMMFTPSWREGKLSPAPWPSSKFLPKLLLGRRRKTTKYNPCSGSCFDGTDALWWVWTISERGR